MTNPPPSTRLGSAMRRLRQERNLSQEALADLAGLDRTFISLLERGRRGATLETAEAIATAFGLSLGELIQEMAGEPSHSPPKSQG